MTDVLEVYPENRISLREVGLRDGLQMVKTFPDSAAKKRWIELEFQAGVRHFEVGSFLPANKYPMFADVLSVIDTINRLDGAHGAALALNKRGTIDALASGVGEIGCVVSATEEHNLANTRRTRAETLSEVENLCRMRDQSDHKPLVNVGIAMSFGCSIAGSVDPKETLRIAEKCYEVGADLVSLADTVGYAGPKQIAALTADLNRISNGRPFGVHLHDTRGMGIANASAALDNGVWLLDGAMGGLGGCPFAPNATGNVVFEDLVFLCESSGFATGIDIEALREVRKIIVEEMPTEPLYGAVAKAGLPKSWPA
ncbi:hydroxymethylglutaryl-CoA lyase [Sneathiella sp.]|jgi:hydroxymethylglutaryl-CoA lyase|uniref:hydroxymethylglutaryl-CoA lyase n=1 Tax=Sneathiella sp. TaxID=1964365 RepID=UPI0039E6A946